jgi:hypothetical protein
MDTKALRMLTDLPADLVERDWQIVRSASRVADISSWHRAVYHRPFDDRLDTRNDS